MRHIPNLLVKLPAHRAGLPGNGDMITRSALTPVLESVAALPAGHPADLPVTCFVIPAEAGIQE